MRPSCIAPEAHERVREIAAILAAGLVRLQQRHALPLPPDTSPISTADCLDVGREPRLSVHTG